MNHSALPPHSPYGAIHPCKVTQRSRLLLDQSSKNFIRCRGIIVNVKARIGIAIFLSDVECQSTK